MTLHRLLIVDDERVIREGLSEIIDWESLGFQVAGVFRDGREAMAYIEKNPVDAVLTDIRMTFMSGIQLATILRRDYSSIPVVLLSGYKEFGLAREAISAGVFEYLTKPVELDELHQTFRCLSGELRKRASRPGTPAPREAAVPGEEASRLLLKQVFSDMATGRLDRVDELERRLSIAGQARTYGERSCAVTKIFFSSPPESGGEAPARRLRDLLDGAPGEFRLSERLPRERIIFSFALSGETPLELMERIETLIESFRREAIRPEDREFRWQTAPGEPGLFSLMYSGGLDGLLRMNFTAMRTETDAAHDLILRVKDFLNENYQSGVGLAEAAAALGVSPAYLSRLFSKMEGRTLLSYLTEIRIRNAREYLLTTNWKVGRIAAEVGYGGASYFNRIFKKETGLSPLDFRKSADS